MKKKHISIAIAIIVIAAIAFIIFMGYPRTLGSRANVSQQMPSDLGAVWVGPGYYYGYWFNDQASLNAWCQQGYCYEDNVIWVGPGYYYGYWFNNEVDFWGWRGGRGRFHGGHHGGGHRGGGHHGGGHHGGGRHH